MLQILWERVRVVSYWRNRDVIIRTLLESTFNILSIFIRRWEIQTHIGLFFRKVGYTNCDVAWWSLLHVQFALIQYL
jgi:hypothetical protein